jgi:Flp pilus assembly protein TadD
MKTKEIAFTLPFIVMLYEFSFFGRPGFRRLGSLTPMLLTGVVIPLSMLNIQKPVGEVLSDVSKATAVLTTLPRWEYLCTQFSVIVTYLRLLFLPINQNLDYDYPINRSIFELRAILSLCLLAAIFSAAIILWRRSRHGGEPALRLAAFGIFWFFITLMVESSVIPILDVFYEHRVYLPSVGFFITLVTLAAIGVERLRPRMPLLARLQLPLLVVVAVLLGGATYARNVVWHDSISLWGDAVFKSPKKARPMILLGEALTKAGRDEEAIGLFRRAIQLAPCKVEDYYYNIAVPFNDLGYILARQGKYAEAIEQYAEAIRLKPDYTLPYVNLGMALADQGRFDDAVSTINYTFRFKPESEEASEGVHTSLGIILARAGKLDDAIAQYELVLRTNPLSFTAQNNLGITLAQMGRQNDAIDHLTKALRINPLSAEAHFNLGILLARQNRTEDAMVHFSEVLKLRPDSSAARQWLEKLRNQK